MGKKCCVTGCRSGYDKTAAEKTATVVPDRPDTSSSDAASISTGSSDGPDSEVKVSFHKFPDASKEPDLRRQWIRAIPREH